MEQNSKQLITLKSVKRQSCPLFPIIFSILLEAWETSVMEDKEIKGIQAAKEEFCIIHIYR